MCPQCTPKKIIDARLKASNSQFRFALLVIEVCNLALEGQHRRTNREVANIEWAKASAQNTMSNLRRSYREGSPLSEVMATASIEQCREYLKRLGWA